MRAWYGGNYKRFTKAGERSPTDRPFTDTPMHYSLPSFLPTRVFVIIDFAKDKRFGPVVIGQRQLEGNTTAKEGREAFSLSIPTLLYMIK